MLLGLCYVRKNGLRPFALLVIALETIKTHYAPDARFHNYNEGSLLAFAPDPGVGVFCELFSFYLHVGFHANHYDREVEANHLAVLHPSARLFPPNKAVILSDLCSALYALPTE
ncbi:hypothetical protein TNCT_3131 [Trichonephila clavata]|uniref:Uncharacterized protein n=1 Tax=Trichonephila clavata TaxID=2740835 RepID=A0A8X6EYP0_TRICU|nr:hypothetical protein TNCT_3131 [Trichonephila clavata]